MSNISSKHPQFTHTCPDWTLMRDAYKGERHVKERGVVYLPPTEAMVKDGMNSLTAVGARAYHAYKMRARFSNFVREAVQMAIGMMHSQPPRIDLPEAMKDIRGFRGETLPELLRKINTEQLITGRVGLMADLPISPLPGQDIPCLSIYKTESIINWDDGNSSETVPQKLNLVVLDESGDVRDEIFGWKTQSKYRVLIMGDAQENEQFGRYTQGVFIDDAEYNPSMMLTPSWRGRTLQELPFVIINSCDVAADVDDPPLLDLGNICMTIYRGDADYRQNLFLQGQDTLVTVGANFDEDQEIRVGAGARIDLPLGGTAEYVGVGASGLSEQRAALDKLDSRAGSMGAQTLDSTSRERESGDSLRIRIAARTADMTQSRKLALSDCSRSFALLRLGWVKILRKSLSQRTRNSVSPRSAARI